MQFHLSQRLFHLIKSAGRPAAARLSRWQGTAQQILGMAPAMQRLTDDELRTHAIELKWKIKSKVPGGVLLPTAFALAREASRRAIGLEHYPVQLIGGMALYEGGVAEMQTGEGKTLTAVPPVFLRALMGLGAHVVTTNDYLARRDATELEPIYNMLGLTVGCIQTSDNDVTRRQAYAKDVTYGTAKELGFDFLRDRLKTGTAMRDQPYSRLFGSAFADTAQPAHRGFHFALVDEADSIFVDEARTPLIIALTQPNDSATVTLYRWSNRVASQLTPGVDYIYEPDKRISYLTDDGCRRIVLLNKPALLDGIDMQRLYKQVEQALIAQLGFQRNRDYVVQDEKIVIVDESTGRMMDGRKWRDGLHQAVESKEHIPITAATGQAARITVQTFFRHYTHLAGMTGTAAQVSSELYRTFKLRVSVIPTHRPCIRTGLPTRIFKTLQHKLDAVTGEIARYQAAGRAILVGTPSVDRSEVLSAMLKEKGIRHTVLNAYFHEQEASIVAEAGLPGTVTIATNMAGRGTDIKLHPDVRAAGGLHVIATELHSSMRIDRQLIGRSARQGDPGTYQFFLSFDDELLRCLEPADREAVLRRVSADANGEVSPSWMSYFRRTQRFLEKMHRKQRRDMLRSERFRRDQYEKMGLDPFLEMTD